MNAPTNGCGAASEQGYRCTHHRDGAHHALGTEAGSWAESWPMTKADNVAEAIEHLKAAREHLKAAGATKALARTRSALSSAYGARRHAELEPIRQRERGAS